jgi:pyruvate/2-oxoglutarate dehydrogenase complex dihydrolipoamide dehydrogenase (E3) component
LENIDILVIGGGTAGEDAAKTAVRGAGSVGLIEMGRPGGACIYSACIPTKSLVNAARTWKKMQAAGFFGLPPANGPVDYARVKAFKDGVIGPMGVGRDERLEKAGVRLFKGEASFVSPNEVTTGGETIRAEKIIIATGSLPAAPPVPGLKETGFITNVEALELEKVPPRLAIIGGGAVGVEFAQIFSAFGARVHIYEVLDRILFVEDEEISAAAAGFFGRQGVHVWTGTRVEEVRSTADGKLVKTRDSRGAPGDETFDEILVAVGRRPRLDGLNLEAAGVRTGKKGIEVDATMQTSMPHIWAAGDVTGTFLFTFVAWEQGDVAAVNATGGRRELDYRVLPRATFCDPEIASVGLTERQAREQGVSVKTGRFNYADLTLPVTAGETDGFFKIIAEAGTGRIIGGHIIGSGASSLVHEVAAAMAGGLTARDIGGTFHAFPTLSEGVRYACQAITD